METKEDLSKMYYKEIDIRKSYFNESKIMITNNIYCIVNILGFNEQFAVCIFVNNQKNRFECFKDIEHFNKFVKWQRWLND